MKQPRGFPGLAVRCLLILLALAACGSPATAPEATTAAQQTQATATTDAAAACRQMAVAYGEEMEPIVEEWQDAVKLAEKTSRAQLATQISALQAVKRKADDVTPPDCAKKAHGHLVTSMENTVDGFLAFMSQQATEPFFTAAADEQQLYLDELLLATTPPEEIPAPPAPPTENEVTNLEFDLFQAEDLPKAEFAAGGATTDRPNVIRFYTRNIKLKSGRSAGFISAYVFGSEEEAQAAAIELRNELPAGRTRITDIGNMAYTTLGAPDHDDMVFRRCFVVVRINMAGAAGTTVSYASAVDKRIAAGSFCK